MLETTLAVIVVTSLFLCLFRLSHMLTGKILLEHAAMRVARARAVGLNDFMCRKVANVAMIPLAGRRIWPEGDEFDYDMELHSIPDYLASENAPRARGVLEYEGWHRLSTEPGKGTDSSVGLRTDWFDLTGRAGIEEHFIHYMNDQGL